MWTVFKKEMREGWLFLLINTLWLVGVPIVMQWLLPTKWDADATSIFYGFMFGLFVPLYLIILAAGLVHDENTFLVRGLPVKPWKVAGGKLLYLALNMVLMEFFCLVWYLKELQWPLDSIPDEVVYFYLYTGATAVAALTTFAFASFLPRKSYAIFAALAATILGMGSLIYLFATYSSAVALDRIFQVGAGGVLLLLPLGAVVLYGDWVRQSRRRWLRAVFAALLLPALAGAAWLRAPLWLKQSIVGDPYNLEPAGDNLFISYYGYGPWREYREGEPFLYDAAAGTLRPFPFLGDAEIIVGTDPRQSILYTATRKPIVRDQGTFRKYSAMELATGKTRELGLLPYRMVSFKGNIARWSKVENKDHDYSFGFKDLTSGATFEFDEPGCRQRVWGSEGVLYSVAGETGTTWMFVDYATGQPREVFRGEYFTWPWGDEGGYFLFPGVRDFNQGIPYDGELMRWDPRSGEIKALGRGRPLVARDGLAVTIGGTEDGRKSLSLYRDGVEISRLETDFVGGYVLGDRRLLSGQSARDPWELLLWSDEEREAKALGILTVEGNTLHLDKRPLPPHTRELVRIPGSDDVLLYVRPKAGPNDLDLSICRVYRLDPASGRMRRMV